MTLGGVSHPRGTLLPNDRHHPSTIRQPVGAGQDDEVICKEDDCGKRAYARGWCAMHYKRWLRTGSPIRGERPKQCAVDGCERPAESRGWCHGHYQRWRNTGDVRAQQPVARRRQAEQCHVEDCTRSAHGRGLCRTHLARLTERGDVIAEIPIGSLPRPPQRRRAKGWITNGYRYVPVPSEEAHLTGGASYEAEHRLVIARHLGRPLRADENVHHRNGDRLDNRLQNLELWSVAQPSGQRVSDKVTHALAILRRYAPELLRE